MEADIGTIRVLGVDGGTARGLGPAIEAGLRAAWTDGRLPAEALADLRITVPHGATADDIVRALVGRLTR